MKRKKNIVYVLIAALIMSTASVLAYCEPTNPAETVVSSNVQQSTPEMKNTPQKAATETVESPKPNTSKSPTKSNRPSKTTTDTENNKPPATEETHSVTENSTTPPQENKQKDNSKGTNTAKVASERIGPKQFEFSQKPDDLPEVDSSEITLPEVVASNDKNDNSGIIAGAVAWACIAIGIIIILVVLVSGYHHNKENLPQKASSVSKKHNSKRKHLLPSKYYNDKY